MVSLDRHVASTRMMAIRACSSIHGDFLAYPFPDKSFDVILCLGTLFYLRDGDAALLKMHRLLRPAGMLIVNCINQQLIRRYFGMALEEIDDKFSAACDTTAVSRASKKAFPCRARTVCPAACSGFRHFARLACLLADTVDMAIAQTSRYAQAAGHRGNV